MERVVRHWTGIVILLAWINWGYCDDPVLTPETLTDSGGNTANANSSIKWAPLPSFDSYSAGDIKYDASGMAPLNNFAKSFINGAVFPLGVPWGEYLENLGICMIRLPNLSVVCINIINYKYIHLKHQNYKLSDETVITHIMLIKSDIIITSGPWKFEILQRRQ